MDLLFNQTREAEQIILTDGTLFLTPAFYQSDTAAHLFAQLRDEITWQQGSVHIFGKDHQEPRLTAWFGDEGARYRYSGRDLMPQAWTPLLANIKQALETHTGHRFNSVLLNYYRDERDGMGWHSDDEAELGAQPVIASLSLGASRRFKLRHKSALQKQTLCIALGDGDLLVMAGAMQENWQHSVPKETRKQGARINLTFRLIKAS
jgi:alkylated DNA repair dioxygenase AlkB